MSGMGLIVNFTDFNLSEPLFKAIEDLGYKEPTEIQEKCMPLMRAAKDVSGLSQTGTGKTAAFLMPVIDRLIITKNKEAVVEGSPTIPFEHWSEKSFILVLVPTRELAEQVYEQANKLLVHTDHKATVIYGGTSFDKQFEALEKNPSIIVATPGRFIDLHKQDKVDVTQVEGIIFDEADRMFDMGFREDMEFLLQRVPRRRQFLVFSATLNFEVLEVAYEFGSDPIEIEINKDSASAEYVKDELFHVGQFEKPKYLLSVLKKHQPKQAIIFSNFKRNIPSLEKFLLNHGFPTRGISSSLSQSHRNKVMKDFQEGEATLLVATDVAARGLDVKGIDLVINYELPDDAESYVHRIGRTGRAGASGAAVSLVSEKDLAALNRIKEYLNRDVETGWLEDDELIEPTVPYSSYSPTKKNFDNNKRNDHKPRKYDSSKSKHPRSDKPRSDRPRSESSSKDGKPAYSEKRTSSKGSRVVGDRTTDHSHSKAGSTSHNKKPYSKAPYKKPYDAKKPTHKKSGSDSVKVSSRFDKFVTPKSLKSKKGFLSKVKSLFK